MATTTARPRLVFPLALWGGPSGVTFIQTLNRDPISGDYFIGQADDVAGQSQQDMVIRRHGPNLVLKDSRTIKRGGHGLSLGVEHDEDESKLLVRPRGQGLGSDVLREGREHLQAVQPAGRRHLGAP